MKKERKNAKEIVLAMPFFVVMFYLMILGFIWPLRPTRSVSEKRELDRFPDFSVSEFFSGSFTDKISHWFADTFPGREGWLKIDDIKRDLHGIQINYIDITHIKETEDVPEISSSPVPEPSPSATPEAEQEPEPTPFTMEQQATEFRAVDPDAVDIEIYSGAFIIGDTAYASQGFSKAASDKYGGYISVFADRAAAEGMTVYNVIAPTSVGILLPGEVRAKVGCAEQDKAISYVYSVSGDKVKNVSVFDIIKAHSNEYVYYHTDHHWSGLGAYYAYLSFCEVSGEAPVSLDEYEVLNQGEFVGSFAASLSHTKHVKRDEVTVFSPPGDIIMTRTLPDGTTAVSGVVIDKTKDYPSNKYNAYIGGDNKLTVITNNDLPDAPDCLVIKDSFGNPFSIYLSEHYHNVYIIDYRKVDMGALEYARQFGVKDIIICQSIGVSQSSSANGLLGQVLLK